MKTCDAIKQMEISHQGPSSQEHSATVGSHQTRTAIRKESLRQRMRQFYETSETYKGLLAKHNEAYQQIYVELVNHYAPPNAQILDLGCGNGISAMLLSQFGHQVVGTDISPLFLKEARKWESDRLNYRVCDAIELPFSSGTFDVVSSNELVEHLPDVETALMEMIRVTRKGGRIIISGPNLCSPLMPLVDLMRMVCGKPGRPIWAETKRQALENTVKNFARYFKKRLSAKPQFLYREPDLEDQIIGGDADSAYYANPIDLEKFFRRSGLQIVKRYVGISFKGKVIATCFPRLSPHINMVVQK